MRKFKHILYATTGIGDDTEGLKQALSLARSNQTSLKILVVYPELPHEQQPYQDKYLSFLADETQSSIRAAREALGIATVETPVEMVLEASTEPPAIHITRFVIRGGHDLLIKEAEAREDGKGFRSIDMTLLRKCPCPLWLARPISGPRTGVRIAVAVSTENRDLAEHDLSLHLLEIARSLADTCGVGLDIVSCWDFEFERYLRNTSRVEVPEHALHTSMNKAQSSHQLELSRLVAESGIGGSYEIHRLKGRADKVIPLFVESRKIDILVMGSLARSGILGYFIGNTAENIIEEIGCSLLTMKPAGFVSPVKAY